MKNGVIHNSERFYGYLLRFYPKRYRQQFGHEMQYVFSESLKDTYRQSDTKELTFFWLRTIIDVIKSLVVEHRENWKEKKHMKSKPTIYQKSPALVGFLSAMMLVLPLALLNMVAGTKQEPFYAVFKEWGLDNPTNGLGLFIFSIIVFLLPVGAYIALRPVLQKTVKEKWYAYIPNIAIAAIWLLLFFTIAFSFGEELYRCDILQISNCD